MKFHLKRTLPSCSIKRFPGRRRSGSGSAEMGGRLRIRSRYRRSSTSASVRMLLVGRIRRTRPLVGGRIQEKRVEEISGVGFPAHSDGTFLERPLSKSQSAFSHCAQSRMDYVRWPKNFRAAVSHRKISRPRLVKAYFPRRGVTHDISHRRFNRLLTISPSSNLDATSSRVRGDFLSKIRKFAEILFIDISITTIYIWHKNT